MSDIFLFVLDACRNEYQSVLSVDIYGGRFVDFLSASGVNCQLATLDLSAGSLNSLIHCSTCRCHNMRLCLYKHEYASVKPQTSLVT